MAKETLSRLKKLSYPNLTIGIHSVISKYNVKNFQEVYEGLNRLQPDSYITEIAEERVELGTVGQKITPSLEDYSKAIDFLSGKIKAHQYNGISNITQAFRIQYYELVKKTLREKRQIIPCYAGFISGQIAPDGEVWACCIKAESMGNLRKVDYDFGKVWFSENAQRIREPIRKKQCFCPLANASYTNMLVSYRTMVEVLRDIANRTVKRYLRKPHS
jgi:MoaA/NifB/PqqE/SkfB family radical SAM enzyme